jgi:fructose-bisphosphate aldolase class II
LLPISMLAIGINNIHGKYPAHWKSLRFDILKEINKVVKKPLVLHGGSGIPEHQIITAIQEGVSKVNINTECQIAFAQAIRNYILQNLDLVKNGYDPRVMLQEGSKAIKKIAKKYFILTKSYGKAFI